VEIFTFYVGQGALAVVRHLGEAVIVDSFLPSSPDGLRKRTIDKMDRVLRGQSIVGLILTGFDCDHACLDGVELILSRFPPRWIMYPKYYKDTDIATAVFNVKKKHEQRRQSTVRPLQTVSVRVDRLDSRMLTGLSEHFSYELFSPHIEDMDCSNNCSIVLKLTGLGSSGFSYLITGDTENSRWDNINRIFGGALRSNVLAAPHHGSKNATNPKTMLLVEPNTVLISAGVDNQYGHPDSQAVGVYSCIAKHIWKTNIEDGVSLFTKPNGLDFQTELFQ
jgi:beta-lactamase superfamily II metal-dependent hydrolase